MKYLHFNKKYTIVGVVVALVLLVAGTFALYQINKFFEVNTLKFQSPVQKPIWIEKRPEVVHKPSAIYEAMAATRKPEYKDPIDQYICTKFGTACDIAVRVARAENGTGQCDRVNQNKNGSIDIGRFQINSLHLKRFPLAKVVECKGNVDVAFQIYTEQGGFQAWVAYTNGSYLKVDLNKYKN